MTDTIRVVEYFYVVAPDKPGEGARALNTLKEAGVNLLAFSGFPQGRRWQLDFIPADPAAFRQAARRAKWKLVGPKRGFLVQGDDRGIGVAGAGLPVRGTHARVILGKLLRCTEYYYRAASGRRRGSGSAAEELRLRVRRALDLPARLRFPDDRAVHARRPGARNPPPVGAVLGVF